MLEFVIPTMTCGHCVSVVTQAIQQVGPLAKVEIDLDSHQVRIDTTEDRRTIESVLGGAGYAPA